jgi:hypothetical protein
MLWWLLKALRLPTSYSYEWVDTDISFLPLDQVDVAASFRYSGLEKQGTFVSRAIRAISDPAYFEDKILMEHTERQAEKRRRGEPFTDPKYHQHLSDLARWRVVQKSNEYKVLCRYFAVAKDPKVARSIFDGREISWICHTPPQLNLPDPHDIVRYFASVPETPGIAVWDYRHFFHQIRLHPALRPYFAVRVGELSYQWRVLPMGWSHSPAISQALAIAVIMEALREDGWNMCHMDEVKDPCIPAYVEAFHPKSNRPIRAYVTYDNVCILGHTEDVARAYEVTLARCEKRQLRLKPGSNQCLTWKMLAKGLRVDHLGLSFGASRSTRNVTLTDKLRQRWRDVLAEVSNPARQFSCKDLARVIGAVLHGHRALHGNFLNAHHVLIAAQSLGRLVVDWIAPCVIPREQVLKTLEEFERIIEAPPVKLSSRSPRDRPLNVVVVAADASGTRGGFVRVDPQGVLCDEVAFPLPEELHIFHKEIIAARRAVMHWAKECPGSRIILLEDNVAAALAISRGWSSSPEATEQIKRLHDELKLRKCELSVLTVPSASNPADETSRFKELAQWKGELFAHLCHNESVTPNLPNTRSHYVANLRHWEEDADFATAVGAMQFGEELDPEMYPDGNW